MEYYVRLEVAIEVFDGPGEMVRVLLDGRRMDDGEQE